MSLATRIIRAPRLYDADRGDEVAERLDAPAEVVELARAVASCSPYLHGLMLREAEWLSSVAGDAPEATRDALLDAAGGAEDTGTALRRAKARLAILTALCDCGGVWGLEEVTGALTRLADLATDTALRREVDVEIARGRLPERRGDPAAGGMVALAMGKMGAHELNYSSDIDLICLFDEAHFDPSDVAEARASFVKATRRAMATLSETTGEGYVFRTDLRLRPDPGVTPVCLGMEAAERYYESLGRTWERAAHIKARPCAGDIAAGAAYLERLRPFVWRRHLDFAAIEDAHAMRLRIRDHKRLNGPITVPGHDMKLGRGGIREIEFFTQTRQIIAGGRDTSLRVRGTVEGLAALASAGWIGADVAEQLTADYRAHREVEHRLQMIADRQTHEMPDDAEGLARLAAFLGRDDGEMRAEIAERLERVSKLTEDFFAPSKRHADGPELTEAQEKIVRGWRGVPALRSERALDIFDRIRPQLLERLLASARPDRALVHFDGFLRGLPAGVQLFSLFEANPELLSLIADVAGATSDLSDYLSRNAGVLDAVLGGAFFAPWPGREALERELSAALAREDDYERRLDVTRSWARDWHFRIGVHHLRGLIDGAEAGRHYADLATAVVRALWPAVIADFATRHGPPPGNGAMVLGMGSLGAGHLTAHSDLDLIVIYDAEGLEESIGPRPLAARSYYARLTQALVTALSAPTAAGRLYEVDMRLRPSGKQGPVATSLSAFARYQSEEAWAWEHMALTRACPVAGPTALCEAVAQVRAGILSTDRDAAATREQAREMRGRLAQAKPGADWNVKQGTGRLMEIELSATLLGLLAGAETREVAGQIAAGREAGLVSGTAAEALTDSHARLQRMQDAVRLLSPEGFDPDDLGAAGEAMILRETGVPDIATLSDMIDDWAAAAGAAVEEVLG